MFIQKAFVALVGAAVAVHALPERAGIIARDANSAGLFRFEPVTKHIASGDRLFRSSAPNYDGLNDSSQKVTNETIKFFKEKGITHVISLNHQANDPVVTATLKDNGIAYTPLQVEDFTAPSVDQLKKGFEGFTKHRDGTLVWCGFGWGRTGTMISALQIQAQAERGETSAMTSNEYMGENHVEKDEQVEALNQLQKEVNAKNAAAPSPKPTPPAKQLGPKEMENQLCSTAAGKNKYEMEESDCRIQVAQCVFEVSKTNPKAGWNDILACMDSKFLPIATSVSAPIWA